MRVPSVLGSTNKVLLILVLFLGWVVYVSLFTSPPKTLEMVKKTSIQDLAPTVSVSNRSIASVTKGLNTQENLRDTAMDVLNVDCRFLKDQILMNKDSFQVRAPKVRLKLIGCGKEKRQIEVSNNTNGYSASLFNLEDASISTDFMDINEGSNSIEIKRQLNGAPSSFILTILRNSK